MDDKNNILKTIGNIHPLDKKITERLEAYVAHLLKWNEKINLIGKSTEKDIWERHILDSAQLLKYIPKTTKIITDFGSGAGLPGIVISIIAGYETHLIESSSKKCAFLSEAARITGANIIVHNARIEELEPWKSDVITARAFAETDELLGYVEPFLKKESLSFLLKGCKAKEELKKASDKWHFREELYPSIITAEELGFVVKLSDIKRK